MAASCIGGVRNYYGSVERQRPPSHKVISCIGGVRNYYGSVERQRPPSHKVIRRLPLLQHVRGLSEMRAVPQPDHVRERPSLQLLADLESHVSEPGKQHLASLRDFLCLEKKMQEHEKKIQTLEKQALENTIHALEKVQTLEKQALENTIQALEKVLALEKEVLAKEVAHLTEKGISYQLQILELKGLNNTCGLLQRVQEVLLASTGRHHLKGSNAWEAILRANQALRGCIEKCTNLKDVGKQAAQCHAMYSVLSQHMHAGKALAALQASKGQILFHRGPLSSEQVEILLCIGKAANFDIAEG